MKLMRIDTHTHSLEVSRCARLQPEEIPQYFKAAGYGAFVLTNHCYPNHLNYFGTDLKVQREAYVDTYRRAQKAGREIGVKVLFGCELKLMKVSYWPEFLLFGFTEKHFTETFPMYDLTQKELFDYCNANNILMYQTHPFRLEQGYRPADLSLMHGLEVYNGHPHFDPRFYQAKAFADSYGLAYSAGSDFHDGSQAGNCGMLVDAAIETQEDLRDFLKQGQPQLFNREGLLSLL